MKIKKRGVIVFLALIPALIFLLLAQTGLAKNTFYTTQSSNAAFETRCRYAYLPKSFKYKIHLTNLVNKIYGG